MGMGKVFELLEVYITLHKENARRGGIDNGRSKYRRRPYGTYHPKRLVNLSS